jgi:hypothetical protein
VSELAGKPVVPANDYTVGHHPPADPGAESDENHVVDTLGGAQLPLRNRGTCPVVVNFDMATDALGNELAYLEISYPIKIRRGSQHSPASYETRDANAKTAIRTAPIPERIGQVDEHIEQRREAVRATRSLALLLSDDLAVRPDRYT